MMEDKYGSVSCKSKNGHTQILFFTAAVNRMSRLVFLTVLSYWKKRPGVIIHILPGVILFMYAVGTLEVGEDVLNSSVLEASCCQFMHWAFSNCISVVTY